MPVNPLVQANYDEAETAFLVDGFTRGFDFQYKGTNLHMLWEKVMKEVHHKRFAGPYTKIPFQYYIQSLVGLVPKGENDARLIFHLSYDFPVFKSYNHYIPEEMCTVQYNDLDYAIRCCLRLIEQDSPDGELRTIFMSKADVRSAFRVIPG